MHEHVVHVFVAGRLVCDGCKTRQAFLVHVEAKRIDAEDEHIDAQVKLEAVNEERIRNVALRNHMLQRI